MNKGILRNERGFTLIEIIAVLVILGILAAVAVPKYIDMQSEAKQSAAQGQVAELKGSLSQAYAKAFLLKGSAPNGTDVLANFGATSGTEFTLGGAPDTWNQTLTVNVNRIDISVIKRGTDTNYNGTGIWNTPQ